MDTPTRRVVRMIPGKDGVPRSAEMQVSDGTLKRPVKNLTVLDVIRSGDAGPDLKTTRGEDVDRNSPS